MKKLLCFTILLLTEIVGIVLWVPVNLILMFLGIWAALISWAEEELYDDRTQ